MGISYFKLSDKERQHTTKVLPKAGRDGSRVATFVLYSASVPADGILVVGRGNNQHFSFSRPRLDQQQFPAFVSTQTLLAFYLFHSKKPNRR
jgi:hypothetical protein